MNLALESWITLFGEGPYPHPDPADDGWRLTFPARGSVNYVTTVERHQNDNADRLALRCRVQVDPRAEWVALGRRNGEGLDPNFRPVLIADMTDNEFARWWPDEGLDLKNGSVRKSWDLDPERWTSVWGKRATDSRQALRAFRRACSRGQYGLTFGGGNAYGHGVRTKGGQASIVVTRFEFT